MILLHWIAVTLVLGIVGFLLIWGMKRHPHQQQTRMLLEIHSDDPPVDSVSLKNRIARKRQALIEQRRILKSILEDNTPDLLVSFWTPYQNPSQPIACSQQLILPMHEGTDNTLLSIEHQMLLGSYHDDIPEKSRLASTLTFISLPRKGRDLVIESNFRMNEPAHTIFIMDSDGKLLEVDRFFVDQEHLSSNEQWLTFRKGLHALMTDEVPHHVAKLFEDSMKEGLPSGSAHLWLATLKEVSDSDQKEARKHLALAGEFSPQSILVNFQRAKLDGPEQIAQVVQRTRDSLSFHTDYEAQAGYLLAQSLYELQQPLAARLLCEELMNQFPNHTAMNRLLQQIKQRERGAQT